MYTTPLLMAALAALAAASPIDVARPHPTGITPVSYTHLRAHETTE